MGLMLCQATVGYTLLASFIIVLLYLFYLYKHNNLSYVDGIFSLSFLMNIWFITQTVGNVYQYDYFNFYMHADYFVMNDFFINNPKMYLSSVYFQPPLWGMIAGLVTKLMMFIGQSKELGFDYVRFVSLFAVSGSSIIFWKLIKKFDIRENISLVGFVFYSFFPVQSILSGLVNNDAMTYFVMISVVYLAYCWYEDNTWHNSILIALLLFIGGMIKFSALMVCAGLGMLILCKLLADKKNYKIILGQSFIIGIGCLLGFAWGIFLLYHHFPLVPPPHSNTYQDMSIVDLSDRLFSLNTVFIPFVDVRGGMLENNVWFSLIKTALFGEWVWSYNIYAYLMYGVGIVFAIIAVISFFSLLKIKLGRDFSFNLFMIVMVFAIIISWIGFWLEYPYFSSTEFRYVAILLPLSLLWIMNWWQNLSLPKWSNYTLIGLIGLFVFAKFMLYLSTI
jgi:hypothetical protein